MVDGALDVSIVPFSILGRIEGGEADWFDGVALGRDGFQYPRPDRRG